MSTILIYLRQCAAMSVPSHFVTPEAEKALHDTPKGGGIFYTRLVGGMSAKEEYACLQALPPLLHQLWRVARLLDGPHVGEDVIVIQD